MPSIQTLVAQGRRTQRTRLHMSIFLSLMVHILCCEMMPAFALNFLSSPMTNSKNLFPTINKPCSHLSSSTPSIQHRPICTKLHESISISSSNNAEEDPQLQSSHRNRNIHGGLRAKPKNGHRNRLLRSRGMNIRLLRPVTVRPLEIEHSFSDSGSSTFGKRVETKLQISSGLTFDDGDQLLVSAQKPLGILLEERGDSSNSDSNSDSNSSGDDKQEEAHSKNSHMGCIVSEIVPGGAADKAGVKEGDLLVAVQNVDVGNALFEEVMERIGDAPRVVNLRFWRKER